MKKTITLSAIAAIVALATTTFCKDDPKKGPDDQRKEIPVESVAVTPDEWSMQTGESKQLEATILPGGATDPVADWSGDEPEPATVVWSSDKPEIATVNETTGEVTAVAAGDAVITATAANGKKGSCAITVNPVPEPVVYVAGQENGTRATLWVDGVAQTLSENDSNATSLFVLDADNVYVAGMEFSPTYTQNATLWHNGERQTLSELSTLANSVFVTQDETVYVAGDEFSNRRVPYARLWVDGEMRLLSEEGYSSAKSVFVAQDGTVYVAGHESTAIEEECATLWIDGEMTTLSDVLSYAYSVWVEGEDVYVAGYEFEGSQTYATVWKNGVAQRVGAEKSFAYSMCVSGADVYATGVVMTAESVRQATLWKNGEAQTLSTTESWPTGVYAHGDDVYVVGYAEGAEYVNYATMWKNGEAQTLSENSSTAVAVVVK
ncbi:MAG: Ig-like domain-containing protein [Alistipes sp.]|jgi:hypothetical protein|nr:Ig-like domain-containing protein [Alistipes sp.]